MSGHREEHLELCAGYALGSLSDSDRSRLEDHLKTACQECEAALADFSQATVMLAASLPAAAPSPALKQRVMAQVRSEEKRVERRVTPDRREPLRPRVVSIREAWPRLAWVMAAAAVLLVVSNIITSNTASRLQQELRSNREKLVEVERQLAEERHWAEVLSSPEARTAELSITPHGVAALRARATYDPGTRSAVLVFENFSPPEGQDYELWALQGEGVASLGVIRADESGRAVMRLENAGDPTRLAGFAVSLEPKGGSPHDDRPTGPVVMAGKFAG